MSIGGRYYDARVVVCILRYERFIIVGEISLDSRMGDFTLELKLLYEVEGFITLSWILFGRVFKFVGSF